MRIYEPEKVTQRAVDSNELAILIRAATAGGNSISFNAPGGSMQPFTHSGDKIFVSPNVKESIRTGDILVFVHPKDGRVLAHRVVKIADGRFFCKGDNVSGTGDGWITNEDVLGRVVRIQRDGKEIHLGLGVESKVIALLSRGNKLVLLVNFLRRIKWGFKRLISTRG